MTIEICADIIAVTLYDKIVLIERLTEPKGLALPGGRLEVNETLEECARREFKEETGMRFYDFYLMGVYSHPDRDPRGQKVSVVYRGCCDGKRFEKSVNENGKTKVLEMGKDEIYKNKDRFAFDHYEILMDYFNPMEKMYF